MRLGATIASVVLLAAPAFAGERICPIGQTIVLLRDDVDPDAAARIFAARYEGVVCRVYRHSVRGVTLRCTGPRVAAALAADPLVRAIEPDVMMLALGQEVPAGVRRVGAGRGAGRDDDGRGVGVAILDTGVDLTHPDLDVVSGASFVDGSPTVMDGQGHGTHVAGIIGARDNEIGVLGVAPAARLFAVKVLDDGGAGALSDVIAGLDWVVRNADRVAVVNMSLGVRGTSPSLRAAIQAAVRAGVVVVAAAGNDGCDIFGEDGTFGTSDDEIPAAFPEVIAVSALADTDDALAPFSCRGKGVALAAPGVNILSCWKEGGYRRVSGTSMAAPHVAGLAARLVSARGRDANGDGRTDERDVAVIRRVLVDAGEPHAEWRAARTVLFRIPATISTLPLDEDLFHRRDRVHRRSPRARARRPRA